MAAARARGGVDPTIRAVVSQGAAMDELAELFGVQKTGGTGKTSALTTAVLRDLASTPVISAPGAETGHQAIRGPTFRNERCARGILRIALNRAVTYADKVSCPVLVVVAENDSIAPIASVHEVVRKLGDRADRLPHNFLRRGALARG